MPCHPAEPEQRSPGLETSPLPDNLGRVFDRLRRPVDVGVPMDGGGGLLRHQVDRGSPREECFAQLPARALVGPLGRHVDMSVYVKDQGAFPRPTTTSAFLTPWPMLATVEEPADPSI